MPACPLSTLRRRSYEKPTHDSGSWLIATHYHVGDFHSLLFTGFDRRFRRGRDTGCPAPPAQIRTCGITAYGSCLGSDAEPLIRIWVYYFRGGEPRPYQFLHALPGESQCFLASPPEGMQPAVLDLCSECVQSFSIAGHTVITQLSELLIRDTYLQ
jgi:hypothetical protein